jgi:predicted DNA-binding transcriptional regulator YafY
MLPLYTIPPKKLLALNILNILRERTDQEHRLSQSEIAEALRRDYQMAVDRKSIRRNLDSLIDAGYDIECSSHERRARGGEIETVTSGWYINREFEDSELRLLIDSLLFSNQIPGTQRHQLIDKLKGLSSRHFDARVRHVHSLPEVGSTNRQLFYTIDVLDEAIDRGVCVAFKYGSFDTTGQLHPRSGSDGAPRIYRIDPYQLVATNGRYYLICRFEPYDDLAYYRVDRILDIELLDEPVKPLRELPGLSAGLDLPRHMAEHIYMFSGPAVPTRFRISRAALAHVFDWFGGGLRFENEASDTVEVVLRVNEQAMRYWALQFHEHVEVLEPQSLRNSLHEAAQKIADTYGR